MPHTKIEIGVICDPISHQLNGLLMSDDAEQLDMDNDAITRCNLMGYMPDSTTARARKKLLSKCRTAVQRFAKVYNERGCDTCPTTPA